MNSQAVSASGPVGLLRSRWDGFLYMAQGIGAIFGGPVASLLHGATGGWTSVFAVAIAALKPMRRAYRLA